MKKTEAIKEKLGKVRWDLVSLVIMCIFLLLAVLNIIFKNQLQATVYNHYTLSDKQLCIYNDQYVEFDYDSVDVSIISFMIYMSNGGTYVKEGNIILEVIDKDTDEVISKSIVSGSNINCTFNTFTLDKVVNFKDKNYKIVVSAEDTDTPVYVFTGETSNGITETRQNKERVDSN
ncbi:MAG: hypothetical protein K6G26_00385, partial [Lachnospiraceae bacterium]|nr:hypothetical protein [Lachnospiraceae bacterium]